jgi:hypothetical protein
MQLFMHHLFFPLLQVLYNHKVLIYIEHHSVCPLVGIAWDSPTPLAASECALPPVPNGEGAHSPAAKGVGESQFQRLEKRLALCLLCVYNGTRELFVKDTKA